APSRQTYTNVHRQPPGFGRTLIARCRGGTVQNRRTVRERWAATSSLNSPTVPLVVIDACRTTQWAERPIVCTSNDLLSKRLRQSRVGVRIHDVRLALERISGVVLIGLGTRPALERRQSGAA